MGTTAVVFWLALGIYIIFFAEPTTTADTFNCVGAAIENLESC